MTIKLYNVEGSWMTYDEYDGVSSVWKDAYSQGYIEGQKAMRERAAELCNNSEDLEDDFRDFADWCAELIRALPIEGE